MSLDVIVLSKDRPDLFASCLTHVEVQGVDYQGWLVDNGTDEETADMAERAGWNVISPGRNTSFSEGNNLAIAASSGDRALLLNNDALLRRGALAAMVAHEGPIVGALITNGNGVVGHAGGQFWRGVPRHKGRGTSPAEWECHACPWVTFAAALITREVFASGVTFDEGYWYGFEDVDFCLTAAQAGFGTAVCADASVAHNESQTRGLGGGDPINGERFYRKWANNMPVPATTPAQG